MSVASPSASALNVTWSPFSGASVYYLDLREVNNTLSTPVVVAQSASSKQALVQGLRPGRVYQVTLKALQFYTAVCSDSKIAMTGKENYQLDLS